MLISKTVKTALLAAAVVVATAGASMAAQYAYVDHDAKVRNEHTVQSATVNHVWEGQKVKVINQWKNWYKLDINGPNGWVKAGVLDFNYNQFPWPNGNGGHVCLNSPNVQFCLSSY